MLKVQEIRELIKLIDESSIQEFSYEENGTSVTMKKTNAASGMQQAPIAWQETSSEPAPTQESPAKNEVASISSEAETEETRTDYDYEITSPMVGTLYSSPSPDSEPYVKIGSMVNEDSVVCIVEAMKLFNEIEAEVSGEIVETLVENGELVEYGQPLFRVKKK